MKKNENFLYIKCKQKKRSKKKKVVAIYIYALCAYKEMVYFQLILVPVCLSSLHVSCPHPDTPLPTKICFPNTQVCLYTFAFWYF